MGVEQAPCQRTIAGMQSMTYQLLKLCAKKFYPGDRSAFSSVQNPHYSGKRTDLMPFCTTNAHNKNHHAINDAINGKYDCIAPNNRE
ncbi:hypothetical protein MO408_27320 (plasmid) [Klebsiella pneumoniae]|nr:hypothetical protein MO408_27320 [Klebsiella pneumoniae]